MVKVTERSSLSTKGAKEVKPAVEKPTVGLITDGKKLSAGIKAYGARRDALDRTMHILACSAVMLAVKDGRADWINELHRALPQLYRDGMRAWLGMKSTVWFNDGIERKPWLNYSAKDNKYTVVTGAKRLGHVPSENTVLAVSKDFELSFIHNTAKKTKEDLDFEVELAKKFEGIVKYLEKQASEGKGGLTPIAQRVKEIGTEAMRMFPVRPVVVESAAIH